MIRVGFQYAGGIFSHYFILINALSKENPNEILYVDSRLGGALSHLDFNFFDIQLQQHETVITGKKIYTHTDIKKKKFSKELWEDQEHVKALQNTFQKYFKVHDNITNKANEFFETHLKDCNVLGVHVRLTNMNNLHPEYGIATTEDYIKKIKELVKLYKIDKVFVASDNDESLVKLKKHFDVVHIDALRYETEKVTDLAQFEINTSSKKEFFEEAMLDMVLLSKCKTVLGRTSSVVTVSMMMPFSVIENYHHL